MANELVGLGGSVKIGANSVASLDNWKVSINKSILDTTSFGDTWNSNLTGLKSWSATASGKFVIVTDTNGQAALQTAFLAGTDVALKLYVDSTHYYSGNAHIGKLDIDASVPELIKISFEFTGNGALGYT